MFARSVSQGDEKAPLKRSLFSKPAWSSATISENREIFHRSDSAYIKSAEEDERRRRKRAEKHLREKARQKQEDERAAKKPKISSSRELSDYEDDDMNGSQSEDLDDTDGDGAKKKESTSQLREEVGSETRNASESTAATAMPSTLPQPEVLGSLTKTYQENIPAIKALDIQKEKLNKVEVIDIESDEDFEQAEDVTLHTSDRGVNHEPPDDHDSAIEEEFPELAKKAREKARRLRLEQTLPSSHPTSSMTEKLSRRSEDHVRSQSPSSPPKPDLQILVTSEIPNTSPLLIHRNVHQRLKDVRVLWIEKQGLASSAQDIFLTWRGKRLFDVTTFKSLGVQVNEHGSVITGNILEETSGQLEIEAVTAEIFEKRKKSKRSPVENEQVGRDKADADEDEVRDVSNQAKRDRLRIICKARGYNNLNLNVTPTTPISKILNAFRGTNQIDKSREIFIQFDGERLEPDWKVESTEISDLDHLDVYVK